MKTPQSSAVTAALALKCGALNEREAILPGVLV